VLNALGNPRESVGTFRTFMTARVVLIGLPLFLACSTNAPPPAANEQQAPPNGCGMLLYTDPACESALDRTCCAEEERCHADPACEKIITCWNICEVRRQELKAKNEPLDQCKCFGDCTPQGFETPGMKIFEPVANCSRKAPFPKNKVCASGC
jgi:hypothetical protein